MNELLPYEEELSKQLKDLPFPDEDASWKDMRQRLDDDRDDGNIIPPAPGGCFGYSLLLILLAVATWLLVTQDKWPWNKNQKNSTTTQKIVNKKDTITIGNEAKGSPKKIMQRGTEVTPANDFDFTEDNNKKQLHKDSLKTNKKKNLNEKSFSQRSFTTNDYQKNKITSVNRPLQKDIHVNYARRKRNNRQAHKKMAEGLQSQTTSNDQYTNSSMQFEKNRSEHKDSTGIQYPLNIDTIIKKATDTDTIKNKIKGIDSAHKIVKKDSIAKKIIYFAAGAALNQQLPVNGQQLVPYNSLGRKGTLADYIPSLYFRIYRDQKWFLQSEFRYGAPQYTKEILYLQKKVVDTFTRTTLVTSNRLKKTYYHQLPVSFNYFVLPHFSIGVGFVWNKFSSAVSDQEIIQINNITQTDSILVKTIFHSKKADSNFIKSYFQALVEAQYQWKRWSFGGRYSFGLQPYLRFLLPGGEVHEEKNSSLQIFFRYNFWESKKNRH